ncbi:bifunctional proline dehydrogenase/L-glutamate gamma-semialdehyde dehydrogenase [Helicobacter ailurogastricus]|uniref:bifunctional proline dehydrogenase/L-glutamate gamma-semialdehyde dehydrogenase n=1 Tax=Helicobacter ailurogastricus TaxID=1578720 RepID=UPI0022CAEA9C|nr:bifunctional proline dehydrogenase/L-glutamate gamma-semialdehyde dehydrogenase [Helicobacter ailurogastricus]GLH57749.1 Delta-1-pyrroline-5-carboxylate dehydrogenase PutA [Helicobacter ailurogastricus]GLH59271.1 Delta-1-pyrroline-5-carboxylate dehydrogenase PutA [Helicobacter ailurogastricus]
MPTQPDKEVIHSSLTLARTLQSRISDHLSLEERSFHDKMQKLLANPENKVMLIELLDRSFRCQDNSARFNLIEHTLKKYGIADFFSGFEKFLLFSFLSVGRLAPSMSVPFFVRKIRQDTQNLVLDESSDSLRDKIEERQQAQITLNINLIGEEVLGESEASYRMHKYEEAIKSDYIEYISIKITTIFSQINILDFEQSKEEVVKRLDKLYGLALEQQEKQGMGKFINLDMEEYKDLELTVAAFKESISKFPLRAGIVLQAYIPESFEYLKDLVAFSKERVLSNLPPIKIRFVKGANMESEETIASMRGWALPTFTRKQDTDSNYNKMLDYVLSDENYKYIHIGIASHNLFEIAYAYTRIHTLNDPIALEHFTFEMLEGMSLQASFELKEMHKLILYAPVCDEKHFNNAIAYLVRRLDENTATDNFMKAFFNLKVDSPAWKDQETRFLKSLEGIESLDNSPRRTQDRNTHQQAHSTYPNNSFKNESDTDFVLKANRTWANKIVDKTKNAAVVELFPVIGRDYDKGGCKILQVFDKIAHQKIATIAQANETIMQQALEAARASTFGHQSFSHIHAILSQAAQNFRDRRGDLIGLSALEVGKTFVESDAEVSEAIDFLEFYPHSLQKLLEQHPEVRFKPKGVGVVIAPWNFPIGISVGTIAAPLAAGNTVIYKPSSLSAVVGYRLCECFWDAGVPRDALIYLPCRGEDVSKYLLKSPDIKFAVLTGSEDTAQRMLEASPTLALSAETGGKNATIVTKMADRDQAIRNVIHSAFSNSGQKCSATSLLILEEEVYNDPDFKRTLVDATKSMGVGDPLNLWNKIGALADMPNPKVQKALNNIEAHEEWAIKPEFCNDNSYLMQPCIKYGTKKGDYTHMTELFVPYLSVMKAKDLKEAIEIANATGYGLTGALESLDEREWDYYIENIEVGNLYINKPSTGAIVLRQPFGGIKKSAVGLGRKVGVYNYATQFVHIEEIPAENTHNGNTPFIQALESFNQHHNDTLKEIVQMARNYAHYHATEFSQKHQFVQIRGEENWFAYTKVASIGFRLRPEDSLIDIFSVLMAAAVCQIPLTISLTSQTDNPHAPLLLECIDYLKHHFAPSVVYENLEEFSAKLGGFGRVRYFSQELDALYEASGALGIVVANAKALCCGRFELLNYHLEKSISISYHRYGNLGARGLKAKAHAE